MHSGDSACVLPPHSLGPEMLAQVREQVTGIALALGVVGLHQRPVRGRRRRPLRDRGQPARVADRSVRLQGDRRTAGQAGVPGHARRAARRRWICPTRPTGATSRSRRRCCPSTASWARTALLGPEMRSTGEVMGIARDFPTAFAKAQAAAGAVLPAVGDGVHHRHRPRQGRGGRDRGAAPATWASGSSPRAGRRARSSRMGVRCEVLNKIGEGSPHVVDWIERGDVDLVVNTPTGSGARSDGYEIRRAAVARGIPCITTVSGAFAAARAILSAAQRGPTGARAPGRPSRRRCPSPEPPVSDRRERSPPSAAGALEVVEARDVGAYRLLAAADPDGPAARGPASSTCSPPTRALGRRGGRAAVAAPRVLVPALPRRRARVPARGRRAGDGAAGRAARRATGCSLSGRSASASRRLRAGARAGAVRRRASASCRSPAGRTRSTARPPRCSASATRTTPGPRRLFADPRVATDDGSAGHHGLVTDLLARELEPGVCARLRVRTAADARGRARAVRRARRSGPARARDRDGVRLRRVLRLRGGDARGLRAPVPRGAGARRGRARGGAA